MALKSKKPNRAKKLTRKQQRKEMRKEKKSRCNEFFTRKKIPGPLAVDHKDNAIQNKDSKKTVNFNQPSKKPKNDMNIPVNQVPTTEQLWKKEKKEQKRIEMEMEKKFVRQKKEKCLKDIEAEDEESMKLLKLLRPRKKNSTKYESKLMAELDLDYMADVRCDTGMNDAKDNFDEDFELMTKQPSQEFENTDGEPSDSDFSEEVGKGSDEDFDENDSESELGNQDYASASDDENDFSQRGGKRELAKNTPQNSDEESDDDIENSTEKLPKSKKRKQAASTREQKKQKLDHSDSKTEPTNSESDEHCSDLIDETCNNSDDESGSDGSEIGEVKKGAARTFADGTWEDIYGRKRGKDGSVINNNESKYIPPAMREKLNTIGQEDKKRVWKLNRLRKQLKGFVNRLAESNMHSISTQVEELYMNNSRNDMNDTLTGLIVESLVSEVMSPERLLIEHVVLIIILHANVGTEVGAHFLQHIVQKFQEYFSADHEVGNKKLDNIVCILAQLYNFKLFDSKLIYDILRRFVGKFKEKDVECVLHILKSVGFTLRKEDPLALKNLILDIQNQAANVSDDEKDNARVKFMLDILLAIKNNNVTKIPNYDTSYSEHMKKVMKGFIRKGNYVTQLNISLDDLLKAEERGRWWVVGSAWTGNQSEDNEKSEKVTKSEGFSAKLLELARKQRMNTDTRRNIFCIMMSAEDYMDAFEKIVKLGLKNQQDREIINVLLHCCLQEKMFNPYYGYLAQKFCDLDRKYQITIKYSIWDKLKSLSDHSGSQISNLAKLLIHLFIEKGLPISTLKIVQFSELDKITLRFMRQILLGILLHEDEESCLGVFTNVAQSDKLKLFRESLRLFIHHFLLSNLKSDKVPEMQKKLLETRAKLVERLLISKDIRAL